MYVSIRPLHVFAPIELTDMGPHKFSQTPKILGARRVTCSEFHTDGPQMVGAITGTGREVPIHLALLAIYYIQRSKNLTPCSRVLLEKLTGSQLFKKFPTLYATRRFITALTTARHLSLSPARSIQSMTLQSTSWRSILILYSHLSLGLQSGLFPSGFPTKTPHPPLHPPPSCYMPRPSQSSWYVHPNDIWWGVQIIIKLLLM